MIYSPHCKTYIDTLNKKHSEKVKTYIERYHMDARIRLYCDCHIGSFVANTTFPWKSSVISSRPKVRDESERGKS